MVSKFFTNLFCSLFILEKSRIQYLVIILFQPISTKSKGILIKLQYDNRVHCSFSSLLHDGTQTKGKKEEK